MADHIIRSRSDKQRLWRLIDELSESRPWRVSITAYKSRRSTDQNNLAWRLYRAVAAETGGDPEQVHEGYRELYGDRIEYRCPVTGKVRIEYRTRGTDTAWFSQYLERVMAHAAQEFGVSVG